MKQLNSITRQHGIKFISASVRGVCGMVFDDFLDQHNIIDIDGEFRKEVMIYIISMIYINN